MIRPGMKILATALLALMVSLSACSTREAARTDRASLVQLDTIKAGQFDTGKMWTFDHAPTEYFAKEYGFNPPKAWFEKARVASLRLPNCSASFVSGDGLVMTNHHCARGALDQVSRDGEDLGTTGYYAWTLSDERRVPGLYVDQLVLMEDVTAEVQAAFERGRTDEDRVALRNRAMGDIELRYGKETGLRCAVVTFYNGGKYSVYGYKRYDDVRLVFAPEQSIAYFGGDPDNFTYPRYNLDVAFFRVYGEDGSPVKSEQFLKWSAEGAQEGEAVFVIGNPGRTSRLQTVAQLEFNRDFAYPATLAALNTMVRIYSDFIESHPEKRQQYQTRLFGFTNSQKVFIGRVQGLHDPVFMTKKRDFESKFHNAVASSPELQSRYESLWREIEDLQEEKASIYPEFLAYQFRGLGRSPLFAAASDIVEFARIAALPDAQRPRQFQGAGIDSMRMRISAPPVEAGLDEAILEAQLSTMASTFGGRNGAFNTLLGGRTPGAAAKVIMQSSKLGNREWVRELTSRTPAEILANDDPLIRFVSETAERPAALRQVYTDIQAKEQARVQMLGKALYDVYGTSIPPDATFTLRIADGVVKKYQYNGTVAPVFTTFYGMYDRYHAFEKKDPWNLPERWLTPPSSFRLNTRFNFVSTNDIIGGNSGSPVVNRNLEVVGVAFDGNIESLPNDFIYTDERNRCVAVHSSGIIEALEHMYKADRIVKELKSGGIPR